MHFFINFFIYKKMKTEPKGPSPLRPLAFNLYINREGYLTEELKTSVEELRKGMNTKRINFNMPA